MNKKIIYFNGEYIDDGLCKISPYDRGFLFSDGIYEVVRYTGKKFIEIELHLQRLKTGLEYLSINFQGINGLTDIFNELLIKNKLQKSEAIVYIQITRGISNPRNHLFPDTVTPTLIANVSPLTTRPDKSENGVKIILHEDIRWSRCNIKTTGLLANVLARQKAFENNAEEAVFVRNDIITEGTHTNFFGVKNEYLITPPLSNYILPGITRKMVLNICNEIDIPFLERNINAEELYSFEELMIVSTKMDVTPVVQLEDLLITNGKPGEITRTIQKAYLDFIKS